jgi:hypothetical protein
MTLKLNNTTTNNNKTNNNHITISVTHSILGATIYIENYQQQQQQHDIITTWNCFVPYTNPTNNNNTNSSFPANLFDGLGATEIVWDRALKTMMEYLLSNVEITISGKQIVELGCGYGLPSLLLIETSYRMNNNNNELLLLPKQIIATDTSTGLLINSVIHHPKNSSAFHFDILSKFLLPRELDWNDCSPDNNSSSSSSNLPIELSKGAIDVILACECLSIDMYGKESIYAFINVIQQFLILKKAANDSLPYIELYFATDAHKRGGDGLDLFLELISPFIMNGTEMKIIVPGSDNTSELYYFKLSIP